MPGQCRRRRLHGAGRVEEIMAQPAEIHRARSVHPTCALRPRGRRTVQPTCALRPRGRRGRRHARQRASPGAVRVARHRRRRDSRAAPVPGAARPRRAAPVPGAARPPCAGRHRHRGIVSEGQRVFLGTGKTPGILVEIFGEIPPRPGQVGNTWEMHYGTNTGSCGVHLVLLRPSQHSGARPGVVPHHGQILVQSFSLDLCALVNPLFHTLWAIGILRQFSGVHIYAPGPILFCT